MKSIRDIADMLGHRAADVARMLYPSGKQVGNEWVTGDINGGSGKSLKINLAGKACWCDFATGETGDIMDLWCSANGQTLKQSLPEIKSYLGIEDRKFEPVKQFIRPEKPRCCKPKSAVLEYLAGRKITPEAIAAYCIAEDGNNIIFPYLRDNDLIFAKRRSIELKAGKKDVMPIMAGMEPCLFGWQAIDDNARTITICEGEIDAPSLWLYGHPAVSVPFGGGSGEKQSWVANEWESLERFETIYLCMDNDEAGRQAVVELISRLGRHRCMVVTLPAKDANECLMKGVEKSVIDDCFAAAQSVAPETLRDCEVFKDEVLDEFFPPGGIEAGFNPPWQKMADTFRFRPSEVTALSGINSHGKSQVAGQIALSAIQQGERVCIASLEMRPRKVLRRMVRQATCSAEPARGYIEGCFEWLAGKLFLFDVLGVARVNEMMDAFEYARCRYGVKFFIVDNFTKCGIAEDDHTGQKKFMDMITDFANEHDCHVMVLFHPRKLENEGKMPGKMDVRGSGSLTDMVHNSIMIWRAKWKEDKATKLRNEIEQGGDKQAELDEVMDKPDAILSCDKQREGDWEGKVGLWFDINSYQYRDYRGVFHPYFQWSNRDGVHEDF